MKSASLPLAAVLVAFGAQAADSPKEVGIPEVSQRAWIVDDGGTLKSETELLLDNPRKEWMPVWVKISVPGRADCIERLTDALPTGRTRWTVHVPELAKDGDTVTFGLFDNAQAKGAPLGVRSLVQKKVRHWRLYVEHNSHQDIGYTDHQDHLRTKKWPSFWDQALVKDMPGSDAWPDDAKVRLEAEGTYQLDQALPVRSADWFETLRARLKEGRFAYGAAFGDMAHNNYGAEELARSTYYADRFLKDKTGVSSSKNVIMRDEPTMSWGTIDAAVSAGAKSFVLQHNYDHNLWRGETAYPEFFYACGRNPGSRLLVWNSLTGNYADDVLGLQSGDVPGIMGRINAKLMGYQEGIGGGPYGPAKAVDGVTGKSDAGEWASAGERNPWLKLAWDKARTISSVRLFDRANPNDNVNAGVLEFSDGGSVAVEGIPADGSAKEVSFPAREAAWVRFKATQGVGANVGLAEIEVLSDGKNIAPEAAVTASSAFGASRHHAYPYDVAMVSFTHSGDNQPMNSQVYASIKAIADKKYAWPKVVCANYEVVFDDLAAHWKDAIPAYKGTVEDWWNFGAASTALETGVNRMNHDKLAAAESLATFAAVAAPGRAYPAEYLSTAYEDLLLYDEHTWGHPGCRVDDQWRWKRNTALAADSLAAKVLDDSLAALSSRIPCAGPTVVVHNRLSWPRTDLVTLPAASLPAHFDLVDAQTREPVRYQRQDDGTVVFAASGVPAVGYKTFRVTPRADEPAFADSGVTATADALENAWFKVAFDKAGNVTSILDKKNGNAEMVDASAPHKLNQYLLLKEGKEVAKTEAAAVSVRQGAVSASVVADGAVEGLDSLRRRVVLYRDLPRIDFVDETVKGLQISNIEMGYFAFPLKVEGFTLRHEMPTGDMKPGVNRDVDDPANEQYYTSSTAFHTVNRWVDASGPQGHGITFATPTAPVVSYGRPDTGWFKGGWDINYNAPKPWIYGMAFNNEWQTNFQKTQPGRVVFRYALRGHGGNSWQEGDADTFGAEVESPLRANLVAAAQPGAGLDGAKGTFLSIDRPNVLLSAAKLAEANGEGLIVRFNETKGKTTEVTVDLGFFKPESVTETDLIENDRAKVALEGGKIRFTIEPFAFKTFRLVRGAAPGTVAGLGAAFDAGGCQVSWKAQEDAVAYEIFRSPDAGFTPGSGTWVATVSAAHWFDPSVKAGLEHTYHYAVRAVGAGRKGAFAAAVPAVAGRPADTQAPTAPVVRAQALHPTKVTLSWLPAQDDTAVQGYEVYRDGTKVATLPAIYNSWLDVSVKPGETHAYAVKARDMAGNLSAAGAATVKTSEK